jgi:ABC-type amino acid transport substrate-binding protein
MFIYELNNKSRRSNSLLGFMYINVFLLIQLVFVSLAFTQTSNNTLLNQDITFTQEEQIWISEHPVLRVTNQMDWPPFDFTEGAKPAGFSIEYIKLISEKIGFKVDFVNGYTWDELSDQLENKKIDITHSILQSQDRDKFLNFTKPYSQLPVVYFGRRGDSQINEIDCNRHPLARLFISL